MQYPFLTFSDLYEEEQKASQPPSPVMAVSPVFLLPTPMPAPAAPSRSATANSDLSLAPSPSAIDSPSSSSSKKRFSLKRLVKRSHSPASSTRSSISSDRFFTSSTNSSANTTPAISRVNTKMSDYEAYVERTRIQELEEEQQRKREIEEYFAKAAGSDLSLKRF